MSGKKDFRGLASTTNHRFIALILRWGKKSKSYSVLLNTFNQCKQLFDLSSQSEGKGTPFDPAYSALLAPQSGASMQSKLSKEIVNDDKNNRIQNFPIKPLTRRHVNDLAIPSGKVSIEKNRMNLSNVHNNVDTYRGTRIRFRENLSLSCCNSNKNFIPFINNKSQQVKARFSEGLSYNFTDLYTPAYLDSQLKESNSFSDEQRDALRSKAALEHFCANKRLISRRVSLKVLALQSGAHPRDFLKQSITTKRDQIDCFASQGKKDNPKVETSSSRHLLTDSFLPRSQEVSSSSSSSQSKGLPAPQSGACEAYALRGKTRARNSVLVSSYPDTEQEIESPLGIAAVTLAKLEFHKKLIGWVQGSKKQDLGEIPKSVSLKKKDVNINISRGICGVERATIASKCVSKVGPTLETRKVRIGGATYAVPYIPHSRRQEGLGIRWLLACASSKRQKSKHRTELCLANELLDSLKNQGESLKKRDQSHQIAANNRAYTRYRWW